MNTVIGTCSICGGAVTVPTVFWAVVPPTPRCDTCGGEPAKHGPVVDIQPPRPVKGIFQQTTTTTTWQAVFA